MDFREVAARALTRGVQGAPGPLPDRERQRSEYEHVAQRWQILLPTVVLPRFEKAAAELASMPGLAASAMANGVHHGRPPGFPSHKAAMLVLGRAGRPSRTLFCAPAYSGSHITFYTVVGPRQIECGTFGVGEIQASDVDRVLALFILEALAEK